MSKIELIIDDSTYFITDSILEFDYFKNAYQYDEKIIFPKILYEQICCYINKYTEDHIKLMIYIVLSFLKKEDKEDKNYKNPYYDNISQSCFDRTRIKILILLYIGNDISHITNYYKNKNYQFDISDSLRLYQFDDNCQSKKYQIGINDFLYEIDELYNTKHLINRKYINICCNENADTVYYQKVYYDDYYKY